MNRKFRPITMLIVLALLAQVLPIPTYAAEAADLTELKQLIISSYNLENESLGDNTSLTEASINCCGQKVSVEKYGLSEEQFSAIFYEIIDSGALPWYAASLFSYSHDEGVDLVKTFTPMYLHPDVYDRVLYEQKVAEILAATVHEGMDQWQAALSIHDYLVSHSSYDETLTLRRGYDLLVRGSAVCSGYAEAYQDLLKRIGIESVIVSSETMGDVGHAWNLVNIYGQWYHVDVTWDDPIPDTYGYVGHRYFLVTDEEIRSQEDGHYDWVTDIQCTDTSYMDAFWKDIDSAVNYPSSQYSYYRQEDPESRVSWIISREEATGQTTIIQMNEVQYIDMGDGIPASYPHYGITFWNGRLYVTTMDSVYSINPDGSDLRMEFNYDLSGNGKFLYGAFVNDGILYLTLADSTFACTKMELALDSASYAPFHTHSYTSQLTEATCTENGYTAYTCSCGITIDGDHILAAGHTYDSGTVILEPTTSSTGIKKFQCLHCDDSYTEQIEQLPKEGLEAVMDPDSGSPVLIIAGFAGIILLILIFAGHKKSKKKTKQ